MQIYLSRLHDYNVDILKRAKDCGFIAVALTVDTNEFGNRENEVRNGFTLPEHLGIGL